MSGGEGQDLIVFILGAALRYRLGEGGHAPPAYGCVMLDEGFVKADSDYAGRALRALQVLGFQLIVGANRDALLGADSGAYAVTLDPPSASAITARAADVSAWLICWRQWAAQHPGVTLRDKKIHTKFGDQPVYTHLDIPDTLTLASLNTDTTAHWQRARDRWDQLSRHHPGQAVQPWLARIVDLDDYDFTTLLAAITWFRANPRAGLTVRSVPVPGMHTNG